MKRLLIKLVMLLLFGAIVNILVAWGFVIWSPVQQAPLVTGYFAGSFSGRNGAPLEFLVMALHVGPGREIQELRAVSQKYDDRGTFMYWIDGRWVDALDAPDFVSQQYEVLWYSAGFPCLSMNGGEWLIEDHPFKDTSPTRLVQSGAWSGAKRPASGMAAEFCRFFPFGPRWPGFAINTLCYAGVAWVFLAVLWLIRRKRRVRQDLCPACAYPIGASDVCTECGRAVDRNRAAAVRAASHP